MVGAVLPLRIAHLACRTRSPLHLTSRRSLPLCSAATVTSNIPLTPFRSARGSNSDNSRSSAQVAQSGRGRRGAATMAGGAAAAAPAYKMIDIGANLLDDMYQGRYNDKQYHEPDLNAVLQRAWDAGVERIIITAGNLEESRKALELAKTDDRLYCTAGVHPTRCGEIEGATTKEGAGESGDNGDGGASGGGGGGGGGENGGGSPEQYMAQLRAVVEEGVAAGKCVAIGECGLDYDRLHFCDADTQRRGFERHFALAKETGLPMFLHLRAAAADFLEALAPHLGEIKGGVVHSFDGTREELDRILEHQNLYIGINGCSLKAEENLAVAAAVPPSRLMVETDCPWCEIRPSHASRQHVKSLPQPVPKDRKKHDPSAQVKGRCEPANLVQVVEAVAGARGEAGAAAGLAQAAYDNTINLFFTR